LYLTVVGGVE